MGANMAARLAVATKSRFIRLADPHHFFWPKTETIDN
ncbi:MAG: hypothetical protein CM15mP95_1640 [Alphaproteobacteria bacterium]|nr:MAG: hypothetical protein CM15mP95_1640 [Alphaproteobacteria bacterium]